MPFTNKDSRLPPVGAAVIEIIEELQPLTTASHPLASAAVATERSPLLLIDYRDNNHSSLTSLESDHKGQKSPAMISKPNNNPQAIFDNIKLDRQPAITRVISTKFSLDMAHKESLLVMGEMYQQGLGVSKDAKKAFDCILKAAKQNEDEAQVALAMCYANGKGTPKDEKAAFQWLQISAAMGNVEAQVKLGLCHAKGFGTSRNPQAAYNCFKKASGALKHPAFFIAQYYLGICHDYGYGTQPNKKAAENAYEKAACGYIIEAIDKLKEILPNKVGHIETILSDMAQGVLELGLKRNIFPNGTTSAEVYNRLTTNDADAAFLMFMQASYHPNVEEYRSNEDEEIAIRWLYRSAVCGSAIGQSILADKYHKKSSDYTADGTDSDGDEDFLIDTNNNPSFLWYLRAAVQSNAAALPKLRHAVIQNHPKAKSRLTTDNWKILWKMRFKGIKSKILAHADGDINVKDLLDVIYKQLIKIEEKENNAKFNVDEREYAREKIINIVNALHVELDDIVKNNIFAADVYNYLKKHILDSSNTSVLYKSLGGKRFFTSDEEFKEVREAINNRLEIVKQKADDFLDQKKYDDAIIYYDEVLKVEPLNVKIYCAKGFALYQLQRYEDALLSYEAALKLAPKDTGIVNSKALILAELNKKQSITSSQQVTEPKRADEKKPLVVIPSNKVDEKTTQPDSKSAAILTQRLSELGQLQTQLQQLLDQEQIDDEKSMQGSYDHKDSKYGPAPVVANVDSTATAVAAAAVTASGGDSKEIAPITIEPIPADDPRLIPRAYNPTPELLKSQKEKLQAQVDVINMRLEWLRANIKSGDEKNRIKLQQLKQEMQPILDRHNARQIELAEQQFILGSNSPALKAFYIHLQARLNAFMIANFAHAGGKVDPSSAASKVIAAIGAALSPLTMGISGAGATIINFFRGRSICKVAEQVVTTEQLFSTVRAEKLFEQIARYLTLRYKDQIISLSLAKIYSEWNKANTTESWWNYLTYSRNLGGAQVLAECVSKRVIHAMQAGKKTVDEWMMAVVESKERHNMLLQDDYLDMAAKGGVTVNQILSGSGIQVKQDDGSMQYFVNPNWLNRDKMDGCYPDIVGFRHGTQKEVEHFGFIRSKSVTKTSVVMATTPSASPASAPTTNMMSVRGTWGVVVEAVGTTHDTLIAELEFQKKQIRFFKAEFLKTETRLKRLEENATASRTTAPASAAQVVVSGAAVKSPIFKAPTPAANRDQRINLNPLQGVELQTRAMPSLTVAGVK